MRRLQLMGTVLLLLLILGLSASAALSNPPPQPPPPQVFQTMREEAGGDLEASWDEEIGVPRFLSGRIPTPPGPDPEGIARAFFHQYKGLYSMRDPDAELSTLRVAADRIGMDHVRFQQVYQGLPVFGAQMIAHLRGKQITSVNGRYIPDIEVSVEPALSGEEAIEVARGDLGDEEALLSQERTELGIYHDGEAAHLAWRLELFSSDPLGRWVYFIDAHEGGILLKFNNMDTSKNRETYDAEHTWDYGDLPGTLVRSEGDLATGDAAVDDAHDYAGTTYDYYSGRFERDSYNGGDATMKSSAHFGVDYNNAFWDGYETVYGDGVGTNCHFSKALDVVAHEWTHAVTEYSASLWYLHQSGALNESYSDVFAAMVDPDWLMGEDLCIGAIRSLANPPAYDQPDHMDEYLYLPVEADAGGVHINSGIPNKAAWLIANGGTHPDSGISVTGIERTKTEQIYYRTLTEYLTPTSRFLDAAYASRQACRDLIGQDFGDGAITSTHCDSVQNGFAAVGLGHEVIPGLNNYIYLPLVMKTYGYVCTGSGTQLLQNTGFESGAVNWVQAAGPYPIIGKYWKRSGNWSAWFGGYYNANDQLYQQFNVPADYGSSQWIFYLYVYSEDSSIYPRDYFYVELQDGTGTTIGATLWVADNRYAATSWYEVTVTWYEFEPYTNQPLRVLFWGTTNSSYNTNFFVDDVTFKIYCGYEAPSPYVPVGGPYIQIEPLEEGVRPAPPEATRPRELTPSQQRELVPQAPTQHR